MSSVSYDAFLSYNTADREAVQHCGAWVQKAGLRTWLDTADLQPSGDWDEAIAESLETALHECTAYVVFIGQAGVGPWQEFEIRTLTRRRPFAPAGNLRIIPVLLPGSERIELRCLPDMLLDVPWVKFRETVHEVDNLDQLVDLIRGKASAARSPTLRDRIRQTEGSGWPVIGSTQHEARAGRSAFERLFAGLCPPLHHWLVATGTWLKPGDYEIVHRYLKSLEGGIINHEQIVPLDATEAPLNGHWSTPEYRRQEKRGEAIRRVRQVLYVLDGISHGGDGTTAHTAALGRPSRMVRNVVRLLLRASKPLVLLGDPGSGKSTMLLDVQLTLARRGRWRVAPAVPVYVRLGGYRSLTGSRPGNVLDLIERSIPRGHEDLSALLPQLIAERRLVVVFDGLDEMPRLHYADRVRELSDFARQQSGGIKTLFSCRINDFSPEFAHRQVVLRPFSRRQIREYIQKSPLRTPLFIDGERHTDRRLTRRLFENEEFGPSARNPLILSLICQYVGRFGQWPASRSQLFAAHLEFLYERLRHSYREIAHTGDEHRRATFEAWARLALTITNQHAGIYADLAELRAQWDGKHVAWLLESGRNSGLLTIDGNYEGAVRFSHHRMQEYLTARFLSEHAEHFESVEWETVVDSPRWQEVLLHLASIQQGDSPALRILEDSMHAVHDMVAQPNSANTADDTSTAVEPASADDRKWKLPADVERRLAERVVLASSMIREVGREPRNLSPRFIEIFTKCVVRLASEGRPTTQVEMLSAWRTAAHICSLDALDAPLRSEVGWVRESAIRLVASLRFTQHRTGDDLGRELAYDMARQDLIPRLPTYFHAAWTTSLRWLPLITWALVCHLLYVGGVLSGCWAVIRTNLHMRPLHAALGAYDFQVPTTDSAALGLLGITFGFALAVAHQARLGVLRSLLIGTWATCLLIHGGHELTGTDERSALFIMLWAAAPVAAVLATLSQLALWLSTLLYLAPFYVRSGPEYCAPAVRMAKRYSDMQQDRVACAVGVAWCVLYAVFAGIHQLDRWIIQLHQRYPLAVWLPVGAIAAWIGWKCRGRIADGFGRTARILFLSLMAAFREARWSYSGKRRNAWRAVTCQIRALPNVLWSMARRVVNAGRELAGLILLMFVVVAPAVLVEQQVQKHIPGFRLYDAFVLAVLVLLITIPLLLVLWSVLPVAQLFLRRCIGLSELEFLSPNQWLARVERADPHEQALYLEKTSYRTLKLPAQEFLELLERLEGTVTEEPAVSRYWRLRHTIGQVVRLERLGALEGSDFHQLDTRVVAAGSPPTVRSSGCEPDESASNPAGMDANQAKPGHVQSPFHYSVWKIWPILVAACGAWLIAAAINGHIRANRALYLINGSSDPLTVTIGNHDPIQVPGFEVRKTVLPEGTHSANVMWPDGNDVSRQFRIESGTFARFFRKPVCILNIGMPAFLEMSWFGPVRESPPRLAWQPLAGYTCFGYCEIWADYAFDQDPPASPHPNQTHVVTWLRLVRVGPEELPASYSEDIRLQFAKSYLHQLPYDERMVRWYADFCEQTERLADCRDFLGSLLELRPVPLACHEAWIDCCCRLDQYDELAPTYDRLLALHPNDADLLYLRGLVQPRVSDGLWCFEEAIRADPNSVHAWLGKAWALEMRGDLSAARDAYLHCLELPPDDFQAPSALWRARWNLFHLELGRQELTAAEASLQEFQELLDPAHPAFTVLRLRLAVARGDLAEAERARSEYYRTLSPSESRTLIEARMEAVCDWSYLLQEFQEVSRNAASLENRRAAGEVSAFAKLELGNRQAAANAFPIEPPLERGLFLLLASLDDRENGFGLKLKTEAIQAFRRSRSRMAADILEFFERPDMPSLAEVNDLTLDRFQKATLLMALCDHNAAQNDALLDYAGQLVASHYTYGRYYLERIIEERREISADPTINLRE